MRVLIVMLLWAPKAVKEARERIQGPGPREISWRGQWDIQGTSRGGQNKASQMDYQGTPREAMYHLWGPGGNMPALLVKRKTRMG